jgi:hypothetical protein
MGGSTGGTTSTRSSTGGGTILIPSTSNPFGGYAGTPLSAGLGQNNALTPNNSLSNSSSGSSGVSNFQLLEALSATQGSGFGGPLYPQTKTGSGTGTTLGGGLGGGGGTGTTIGGRFPGVSTFGMRRAPTFVTALAEDLKPSGYSSIVPAPNQMVMELRGALDRSSSLREPSNIRLYMEDSTVVLQGVVTSDKERRLAEGLVRVTPGVRDVRNELVVNRPTGP